MSSPEGYLIEDDYDSEFRYKGKPIPALQGMDQNGCVIYMGTFSKAIAPAIPCGIYGAAGGAAVGIPGERKILFLHRVQGRPEDPGEIYFPADILSAI